MLFSLIFFYNVDVSILAKTTVLHCFIIISYKTNSSFSPCLWKLRSNLMKYTHSIERFEDVWPMYALWLVNQTSTFVLLILKFSRLSLGMCNIKTWCHGRYSTTTSTSGCQLKMAFCSSRNMINIGLLLVYMYQEKPKQKKTLVYIRFLFAVCFMRDL